jgi:single-strand DNA-binding protein
MSGETVITIIGNLTADPEIRYTPSGSPVADFTVATNPRHFDKGRGEWVDDQSLFLRASVWREQAENVADTLRKGMRVIVQGRLVQRRFQDKNGQERTVVELQADEIGPSLRNARAQVTRQQPHGAAQQGAGRANRPGPGNYTQPPQSNAQWATQPARNEPPF